MTFLADYELIEWLGPGNHGDWWLARPPARLESPDEFVAVKALWRDASELDFERMARELRLLSMVRSPHLVHLIEAGESDGRLFYVRSHHPDGALDREGLPTDRIRRAMVCAARGANALHDAGIAHRDIKPDNVLLTTAGAVLSELGLAQLVDPGMTTGIGPVGAIEYVAPEVALGERGSASSDIWALGVTLHRVLCGVSIYGPQPPENVLEGFRRVTGGQWELSPSLADADRELVASCLQQNPAERLSSASVFADRLEGVAS